MSWNGWDLWEFGYSTVERVTRTTSVNYSFTEIHSSRAITFLNYRLSEIQAPHWVPETAKRDPSHPTTKVRFAPRPLTMVSICIHCGYQ